eukprot:TRINITY_DN1015_c0_g1_i8.p3 TRINITY_DN1015_c0_g1~~TRINITY_DN1015_c0_g1_i8.p3  ORF type:complete len:179 (+),score=46.28 TRINITY_DN1015_c0_g1_i8:1371-1907(+)
MAAKMCLQGFDIAQQMILSSGKDEYFDDVGTTTMIAGGIVELEKGTWGFISAAVGDCKAYQFSIKDNDVNVRDLVIHPQEIRKDMSDPGGRLGPQCQDGEPDLRNFYCWFEEVEEGDIVMICSDGVHDNFDPEVQGIPPNQLGLDCPNWDKGVNGKDRSDQIKGNQIFVCKYIVGGIL